MRDLRLLISFFALAGCGGATPVSTASIESAPASHVAARALETPIDSSFLDTLSATRNFKLGRPERIAVSPNGERIVYLQATSRDPARALIVANGADAREVCRVDASRLLAGGAETLSVEERARRERMRLSARGIASFTLTPSGQEALVPLSGKLFRIGLLTCAVSEIPLAEGPAPIDARFSPDEKRIAFVRDGNLVVLDLETRRERAVTTRANDNVRWGEAEFVAQEEMDRMEGYWWSPDGNTLLAQKSDTTNVETFRIADPLHPERAPDEFPYPRAGTANADVSLHLIPARGGRAVEVRWDRAEFPYVAKAVWSAHGPATILVQNRTQTRELLLAIDARTGETRTLLEERDDAWLNIDPTMPRYLPGGSFLWSTERRGFWQAELRGPDGALVRELTPVTLGYRKLVHVPASGDVNTLYVQASADSTETQIFRVSLDGATEPARITTAPGEHEMTHATSADVWVDDYESWEGVREARIHRAEAVVETPLSSVSETPPYLPNAEIVRLTLEGREHVAMVIRPREMVPGKNYPVLASVYGGPHYATIHATRSRYFMQQWFADQGFVVVLFDGRGTPYRGREWERATSRDLIGPPLQDWVAALNALDANPAYDALDFDRTGVYGWSFGGYFTLHALTQAGETFRAGVSGAPVADWRDYDTHYTERYMGLPAEQTAAYDASSAITYAASLARPLLLIHGTADDNVYFLHSLRFVDELTRNGKSCEFLPLPGQTHMVTEPALVRRMNERMVRFFRRELGAPLSLRADDFADDPIDGRLVRPDSANLQP